MAQTIQIQQIAEWTNTTLVDLLEACGPVTPTNQVSADSLAKSTPPQLFPINLSTKDATKPWLEEYSKYRSRSPILTSNLRTVRCEGDLDKVKMTMEILNGHLIGSAITTCSSFPHDTCSVGTCDTLIPNQSSLNVDRIEMDPRRRTYGINVCLNELVHINSNTAYTDLMSKALGTETAATAQSLAIGFSRAAVGAVEYAMAIEDFLETTDKGLLATVEAVDGTDITLSDTVKLEVVEKGYLAVFRPGVANVACLHTCATGQTYNFIGYIKVVESSINPSTHTATFYRPFDMDGVQGAKLLPAVTLAVNDKIYATSQGTYLNSGASPLTGYFAGTAYKVPEPYPGLDLTNSQHVSGTFTAMVSTRCCIPNAGFWGLVQVAQDDALDQITGGNFYTNYKPFLKPKVICCAGAEKFQLTERALWNYIANAAMIMKRFQMKTFFPSLNTKTVFVRARMLTMEQIHRSILSSYLVGEKSIVARQDDGSFTVNLNPLDRTSIVVNRDGYNVIFESVEYGMDEGQIYIGPDVYEATIVFSDLGNNSNDPILQPYSRYNMGRVAREIPKSFLNINHIMPMSEMAKYRDQIVFAQAPCAGQPEVLQLAIQMSRYFERVPLLGGAATIILNAYYEKPFDCDPNCATITCDSCEF